MSHSHVRNVNAPSDAKESITATEGLFDEDSFHVDDDENRYSKNRIVTPNSENAHDF